jgi:hypothetical protein
MLLPYATSEKKTLSQITTSLKEYRMLLRASLECIQALETLELSSFDALVGENMCQVRALKVTLCAERTLTSFSEIKITCSLKEKKVHDLLARPSHHYEGSLYDIIVDEDIELALTQDEIFHLESFILTKVKVQEAPKKEAPLFLAEKTYPKNLQDISDVSTNFANALIKKLRKDLAQRSVCFIKECARDTSYHSEDLDALLLEHNDLRSLPFFTTNHILLQKAMKEHVIERCGFEQIFLCNSADHRQCLDMSKEEMIETKQSPLLQRYRQDAIEIGCSLTNPSLAFINHAYCSVMKP